MRVLLLRSLLFAVIRNHHRRRLQTASREKNCPNPSKRVMVLADIHCLRTQRLETFTAFLTLPSGFTSRPVLEEHRPELDGSEACLITPTNVDGLFALDLSLMSECGVRRCEMEGEAWLCVLIRFPVMAGLKLPEDEVLEIKCKPQERLVEGTNVLNFQKNS